MGSKITSRDFPVKIKGCDNWSLSPLVKQLMFSTSRNRLAMGIRWGVLLLFSASAGFSQEQAPDEQAEPIPMAAWQVRGIDAALADPTPGAQAGVWEILGILSMKGVVWPKGKDWASRFFEDPKNIAALDLIPDRGQRFYQTLAKSYLEKDRGRVLDELRELLKEGNSDQKEAAASAIGNLGEHGAGALDELRELLRTGASFEQHVINRELFDFQNVVFTTPYYLAIEFEEVELIIRGMFAHFLGNGPLVKIDSQDALQAVQGLYMKQTPDLGLRRAYLHYFLAMQDDREVLLFFSPRSDLSPNAEPKDPLKALGHLVHVVGIYRDSPELCISMQGQMHLKDLAQGSLSLANKMEEEGLNEMRELSQLFRDKRLNRPEISSAAPVVRRAGQK